MEQVNVDLNDPLDAQFAPQTLAKSLVPTQKFSMEFIANAILVLWIPESGCKNASQWVQFRWMKKPYSYGFGKLWLIAKPKDYEDNHLESLHTVFLIRKLHLDA